MDSRQYVILEAFIFSESLEIFEEYYFKLELYFIQKYAK
jgi:hypothetical protein